MVTSCERVKKEIHSVDCGISGSGWVTFLLKHKLFKHYCGVQFC